LSQHITLDLVHPIYNPKPGWAEELVSYYKQFYSSIEKDFQVTVYLVNDGSSTGILEKDIAYLKGQISQFIYLPLERNQGKGAALRAAMQYCESEFIMYTDFDYPYLVANMWEMLSKLKQNESDIVVGVRDEQYYDQLPLRRMIFSLSLKVMNYLFFPRLKVKDTQSGLKGFNQQGKEIFLQTKIAAFLFDMEFLVLASKNNQIKVDWIYLHVRDGVQFSGMKLKTIVTELLNFMTIWLQKK
jgi:glycosyltransferase involved in cell wall biosynthesis